MQDNNRGIQVSEISRITDSDVYDTETLYGLGARLRADLLPDDIIIESSTSCGTNAFFEMLNAKRNIPPEQIELASLQALGKTFGLSQESINRLRPWNLGTCESQEPGAGVDE